MPALRRLRGARRPRQHKQACGASLPAAASAPDPGGGAHKHPGPQALLPLACKTLPPGEGSPGKRPLRGLQHFPRPSEANPEDRGSPQDPPATLGPGSSLPHLGTDTPACPLHTSALWETHARPSGPSSRAMPIHRVTRLHRWPPNTARDPRAQRVTAGAAGGRPHQTPTRHPSPLLTTPPPAHHTAPPM